MDRHAKSVVTYFCSSGSSVCSWTMAPLDGSQTCKQASRRASSVPPLMFAMCQGSNWLPTAEQDKPHSADKGTTGSHTHPGGRLLALLLYRSRFQVQHPPLEVREGSHYPGITSKQFYDESGVSPMAVKIFTVCIVPYLCCYFPRWTAAP